MTRNLFIPIFAGVVAITPAQEPSPREQFQSVLTAYQKAPTREAALKVIEHYRQLDPPPAVPEEARRPFVMGATVLKKSTDKTGATKAVEYFTEALKTAPWFAEAYYNRALAREITGLFTDAMDDLKLYLAFTLSESERREAQDKIYALEADAQLAAAKKSEEDRIARSPKALAAKKTEQDEILIRSLDGAAWRFRDNSKYGFKTDLELRDHQIICMQVVFALPAWQGAKVGDRNELGRAIIKGRQFRFDRIAGFNDVTGLISEDGRSITLTGWGDTPLDFPRR